MGNIHSLSHLLWFWRSSKQLQWKGPYLYVALWVAPSPMIMSLSAHWSVWLVWVLRSYRTLGRIARKFGIWPGAVERCLFDSFGFYKREAQFFLPYHGQVGLWTIITRGMKITNRRGFRMNIHFYVSPVLCVYAPR